MRRVVIAKMLILALWALYLGIVLSRPIGNEFNAGVDKPDHKKGFRFSPNRKFSAAKAAIPAGHAKTTSAAGGGLRPSGNLPDHIRDRIGPGDDASVMSLHFDGLGARTRRREGLKGGIDPSASLVLAIIALQWTPAALCVN
jgi:hypothetical protein